MSDFDDKPTPWNLTRLIADFEQKYARRGLTKYWMNEKDRIERRLVALRERLAKRYGSPEALGVGGSGLVLQLIDRELSDERVALKFPRPVVGQSDILTALLSKEIGHLATLRHAAIVRIHERGTLFERTSTSGPSPAKGKTSTASPGAISPFPYYIMDFIDGRDSEKYILAAPEGAPPEEQEHWERLLLQIVGDTADALRYLHSRGIAHLDIKPENILIRADGSPVIADLGTAKLLSASTDLTIVASTQGYADPDFLALLAKDPTDPNRSKGEVPHNVIDTRWDLYAFGRTLLEWLGYDAAGQSGPRQPYLSTYSRKYLLLMAARMLRGHVGPWLEKLLGLSRRVLKEVEYTNFDQVLTDLRKLSGQYSPVDDVPELNEYHPQTLQVAADGATTYTRRLKQLLDEPALRRLASITQLGVVSQVYPTATHSRLEHSLGTYHNTCRFVLSLYYDPLSPLFRQIVEAGDIRAVLVAALVHDIGQFPLAHDLEETSPMLFDHKRLGTQVLAGSGNCPAPLRSLKNVLSSWKVTPERVSAILNVRSDSNTGPVKDRLLHSIIDGPIDADKLDYLRRDSDRLKVPYGAALDTDRLLRSLTVIVAPDGTGPACVGVHEKAKVAGEFIAIARYALFSQAYWHHTVRAMKAMLARAVWQIEKKLSAKGVDRVRYKSEFEAFVLALPGRLYDRTATRPLTIAGASVARDLPPTMTPGVVADAVFAELATARSTIAATDAAVLSYLANVLQEFNAVEAELLQDIVARQLYKRLFVFSKERSPREWASVAQSWDSLSPAGRLLAYEQMEKQFAQRVADEAAGPKPPSSLGASAAAQIASRVATGYPLILIDLPGARPGSDFPLHYVLEAQRRALRKDEHAVGEFQASDVWREFGTNLRDRAGKVRVFCHPRAVDAMEAAIKRDEFADLFKNACDYAKAEESKGQI